MILNLLTVAVLGFVGFRLVTSARTAIGGVARQRTRDILSGLRWRHFAWAPVALISVLVVASLLLLVPPLRAAVNHDRCPLLSQQRGDGEADSRCRASNQCLLVRQL